MSRIGIPARWSILLSSLLAPELPSPSTYEFKLRFQRCHLCATPWAVPDKSNTGSGLSDMLLVFVDPKKNFLIANVIFFVPTHDDHYNFTLQTSSEMILDSQEEQHDRHDSGGSRI